MTHTVWIKRLDYDPECERVNAELSGEMGGRHVDVQLQFALRAHGEHSELDLRKAIILEIQQILRSAVNVVLSDEMIIHSGAEHQGR